jgi:hypothetical protein
MVRRKAVSAKRALVLRLPYRCCRGPKLPNCLHCTRINPRNRSSPPGRELRSQLGNPVPAAACSQDHRSRPQVSLCRRRESRHQWFLRQALGHRLWHPRWHLAQIDCMLQLLSTYCLGSGISFHRFGRPRIHRCARTPDSRQWGCCGSSRGLEVRRNNRQNRLRLQLQSRLKECCARRRESHPC